MTPPTESAIPEPAIEKRHIERVPGRCGGRPCIVGTRIRVQDIVEWTEAGQSPAEIVASFPHITQADVHAALAYYLDHQAELDREILEGEIFVERMKASAEAQEIRRLTSGS